MPTPEYRTPAEWRAQHEQRARVRAVLDHAIRDGVCLIAAMELDESPAVVELWTNRLWNGLRDGLSDDHPDNPAVPRMLPDEDRLSAIVMLLEEQMRAGATAVITGVRTAGGGCE